VCREREREKSPHSWARISLTHSNKSCLRSFSLKCRKCRLTAHSIIARLFPPRLAIVFVCRAEKLQVCVTVLSESLSIYMNIVYIFCWGAPMRAVNNGGKKNVGCFAECEGMHKIGSNRKSTISCTANGIKNGLFLFQFGVSPSLSLSLSFSLSFCLLLISLAAEFEALLVILEFGQNGKHDKRARKKFLIYRWNFVAFMAKCFLK
jgi:hypothetical protein